MSAVEPSCIYLANRGPFDVAQGSYDAGPVSAVEPSCIYLANRGPFDRLRDPMALRLEATLPFQGSYDAGPVSIVEPSCSYLANHGSFDVAQGSYGQDR